MSVFKAIPKCEICQTADCEPKKNGFKDRCGFCKERFDAKGEPFIVYSKIFGFQSARGSQLYIWAIDDRAWKVPRQYQDYKGCDIDVVCNMLEDDGYTQTSFSDAVYK